MAGQFASVIGTSGYDEFVAAVRTVLDSRTPTAGAVAPMAVLVQPLFEPRWGGVIFGVDPVSGRSDRRVITAVDGGPEALVGGSVAGSRYLVDPSGSVLERDDREGPTLPDDVIRSLVGLASAAAGIFGRPQDIEWAVDGDHRVWLLQSRAVTTEERGVPSGPIFGPGPVAETFPEALTRLEVDLWVPPLRQGVAEALLLTGTDPDELTGSPVVIVIDGHVAIDMSLVGEIPTRTSLWDRVSPVAGIRRVVRSWRVGRLRAALPALADDLLDRADADLESVPPLDELTSRQLLAMVARGQEALRALHAHEILMGTLLHPGDARLTGASVALRVLAEAREDGLSDAEIKRRSPVVLALTAPRVAPDAVLPAATRSTGISSWQKPSSDAAVLREALRLRIRWVQELTGRAAWLLGVRLTRNGLLTAAAEVRALSLDELRATVIQRATPVKALLASHVEIGREPLPACFQVSDRGRPVAVQRGFERGGGTGAGGGVGVGPITHDTSDPPTGSVLVTTTLSPGLAPLLPRVRGIIAETGSVLAHLAILARESGVAIVVGYAGASGEFSDGVVVRVDGTAGEVIVVEGEDRQ